MTEHMHEHEGLQLLTLTDVSPDGAVFIQQWRICPHVIAGLRKEMGEPDAESMATSEAGKTMAATFSEIAGNLPGVFHQFRGGA